MASAHQDPRSPLSRSLRWLRGIFVVMASGLLGFGLVGFVAVEHTAQPAFCGSCHNMLPYIAAWEQSKHAEVACIECHYEPGSLETLEGKFKAITQVAKYITSTEAKPYAEVSDASCLRAGCHSVPSLEGKIQFGRVGFEHTDHVLESRRGRELQCTSCHSHILEGEHFTVTERVCFTCHFKPEADGSLPPHSDCLICHGPPREAIEVAGRTFEHAEFVQRGVRCRECHTSVVKGKGQVRPERCHTCHEEEGHLGRIGDQVFLHEQHVTLHKVECYQCHDDIQHGLLPHDPFESGSNDCRSCHRADHDAGLAVLAGSGAIGVPDHVSRMTETMVDCLSCHTGHESPARLAAGGAAAKLPHHADSAAAGESDCIHCHGSGYAGMLERWQQTLGGQRERLDPLLASLRDGVAAGDPELRAELAAAEHNLRLLARDPSRGAHNPVYALAVTRDVAERIERLGQALGRDSLGAVAGLPVASADGCTSACHLGIEQMESAPLAGGRAFPHRSHLLETGLDCRQCHLVEPTQHGRPAFPRQDCASCHHQEESAGERDCASCHAAQAAVYAGEVEGFEPMPSLMPDLGCTDCHGEAPEVSRPDGDSCAVCHDESYSDHLQEWRDATRAALAGLAAALTGPAGAAAAPADRARAHRALELIRADGSLGAHNAMFAESVLEAGRAALGG